MSGNEHQPAIAVGEGVIYVAHHNQSKLFVERSFDQGATWSAPNRLASNMAVDGYGLESMSLIASGQSAYIAYTAEVYSGFPSYYIRYRGTTNRGGSWSKPFNLTPPDNKAKLSQNPIIAVHDGKLRVTFERCTINFQGHCDLGTDWWSTIMYRQSNDGVTWTRARFIAPNEYGNKRPVGLATAGRVVVLYTDYGFGGRGWVVTRAL